MWQGGEAKAKVGARPLILGQLGGHTTTQPSSIEEEGKMFQALRPPQGR